MGTSANPRPFFHSLLESPAMRLLLALALLCLLGHVLAQTSEDPCAFAADTSYPSVWVTNRTNVLNCFMSIPFNSGHRDILSRILNSTWEAYSFRDYVAQPIAPYNVQVRTTTDFTLLDALLDL